MGSRTTLRVSKAKALEKLVELMSDQLSNEKIEDVLYDLLYDRLYNFSIVDDQDAIDDEFMMSLVP